ncbi:MAG: AmmeMemoRadiSam system protein A [Polyangiales bacterium]
MSQLQMVISETRGLQLCRHARASIAAVLGAPPPSRPAFDEVAATFVTLHRGDTLHGCMGTLAPRRALADDVAHNAVAAAFEDPRATPLRREDVDALHVSVTVLGTVVDIEGVTDEASALAALRPFVDGVVLTFGGRRGTFLPQVWESLPDARSFLSQLKRKAGLPVDFWHPQVRLARYEVQKFAENPASAASVERFT